MSEFTSHAGKAGHSGHTQGPTLILKLRQKEGSPLGLDLIPLQKSSGLTPRKRGVHGRNEPHSGLPDEIEGTQLNLNFR